MSAAEQIKEKLGEGLCLAKWQQVSIHLPSGMTQSCYHPPTHKIPLELLEKQPSALHNTPQKKYERRMMLEGKRPDGCSYCWKVEDAQSDDPKGHMSDRHYRSGEPWAAVDFGKIASSDWNQDDIIPSYVEVNFNNACNLKCSYCSPQFSSSWMDESNRLGPFPTAIPHNAPEHFAGRRRPIPAREHNPYVESFFAWWESDLHKTLQELRITGGEPLMSQHTWRLIEWFKGNQAKSQTRLAINSNLGTDVDIDRLLSAIDGVAVDLYTSNEAIGLEAEYIRDGLVFDDWANNVERLLDSGKFRGLHSMCTINALCLSSLDSYLEMIYNWKLEYGRDAINFTLNILRFPSFQSPLVLPDNIRTHYRDKLAQFLVDHKGDSMFHEYEINQLIRLIDYLDVVKTPHEGAVAQSILQRDFKNFYKQYDQRRNKNFTETFPALADWYNSL